MIEATGPTNDRNSRVEALYIELKRRLEGIAYRITWNHADAEDVVQDVFVSLLEMEPFPADFDANPKAYLQKSARNRAVDVLRTRNCRKLADKDLDIHAHTDDFGLLADSPDAGADPATVRRLRRAMTELEPEAAEMIRLCYWDGYTNAEIAQRKGLSRNAVSKALNDAKDRLGRSIRTQERDAELQTAKRQITDDPID
jgi:RNA polymerase sigma-70 factor, ECF subfamily